MTSGNPLPSENPPFILRPAIFTQINVGKKVAGRLLTDQEYTELALVHQRLFSIVGWQLWVGFV